MMAYTLGPLMPRNIQGGGRHPWALINPNGPFGDEIVAGYLTEGDAYLYAAAPDCVAVLLEGIELSKQSHIHSSDCALHNGPALPVGPCNCYLSRIAAALFKATER